MPMTQTFKPIPGILIFEISGLSCCVNIDDVYLVKKIEDLDPIIESDLDNRRYLRLEDSFDLPFIDLTGYLHREKKTPSPDNRILIMKHTLRESGFEKTFAFKVDKVIEIFSVDETKTKHLLEFIPSEKEDFFYGTILFNKRRLLLPDFSKIAASILDKKIQKLDSKIQYMN